MSRTATPSFSAYLANSASARAASRADSDIVPAGSSSATRKYSTNWCEHRSLYAARAAFNRATALTSACDFGSRRVFNFFFVVTLAAAVVVAVAVVASMASNSTLNASTSPSSHHSLAPGSSHVSSIAGARSTTPVSRSAPRTSSSSHPSPSPSPSPSSPPPPSSSSSTP